MSTPSSPRRYLSIWLRRLTTDRLTRCSARRPDDTATADEAARWSEAAPLVVVHKVKGALRIAALNDPAARLGLTVGLALADACARHPGLAIAQADPAADQRLLVAIADWCDRYTPLVALDAPAGLMLDISGCAHLFGGETALARDIVTRLAAQGLQARVAVAATPGCAWAVARYGARNSIPRQRGERENVFIIPAATTDAVLAPLPLAALRLEPDTVALLADVGLHRIADICDLPRATLAARFGDALLLRLDQTLGRVEAPITPRLPAPSFMAEQHFAEPIARERDVLGTISRLSIRLGYAMEARGEGARRLELALFRTDGAVHRLAVGTSVPVRAADQIGRLFKDRLASLAEPCDPGFGYDLVRLSAPVTERLAPVQADFAADDLAAFNQANEDLAHLIDRLGARLGLRRVTRFVPRDTHIPEFAVAAVPAYAVRSQLSSSPLVGEGRAQPSLRRLPTLACEDQRSGPGEGAGLHAPIGCPHPSRSARRPPPLAGQGWGGGARSPSSFYGEGCDGQDTLVPPRPLRLFARPEPIEAMAEVPDGPPVRFRWRRVLHEVAAAEGPERIALEWWRDPEGHALTRDYFRVESRIGARVWLFREGLYGGETAQPRWFLHGLFG